MVRGGTPELAPKLQFGRVQGESYEGRQNQKDQSGQGISPVLSADTLTGDTVRNAADENLGKIHDIMIDIPTGRVAYAVLSFGGLLGMGNKLFAVPWDALPDRRG